MAKPNTEISYKKYLYLKECMKRVKYTSTHFIYFVCKKVTIHVVYYNIIQFKCFHRNIVSINNMDFSKFLSGAQR